MSNQQGLITFTLNKNGLINGTHNKQTGTTPRLSNSHL